MTLITTIIAAACIIYAVKFGSDAACLLANTPEQKTVCSIAGSLTGFAMVAAMIFTITAIQNL